MSEAAISATPSLGKRVRRARLELGLNQRQFADRLGVNEMSVRRWENDKAHPQPKHLQALSRLTQKPIAYFTDALPDEEL